MRHLDELESLIRDSYKLICEFEAIRLDTDSPKERRRCEREIEGQWALIESYLEEHLNVCQQMNQPVPEDIRQIAAHFPQFLAQDFRQAYVTLQRVVPADVEALNGLVRVLRELGHLHEHLNEWKDLHNLLQECITSLIPLRSELEYALEFPDQWKKMSGLRLWGACRVQLRRLESFARDIKYIDRPFRRSEGAIRGPLWMVEITALRDDLDTCLKEGDPETSYGATIDLWDVCYDTLYQADKRLRNMIGELYAFSNTILRSVIDDKHNG